MSQEGQMRVGDFWKLRNLRGSPFFQDALEPYNKQQNSRYPIDLFVGRTEEAKRIIDTILLMTPGSSRSTIQGIPGVGKTTLVQYIKAELSKQGFGSTRDWISVGSDPNPERLVGQILYHIYTIVIEYGGELVQSHRAVQTTRQLLLALETRHYGFSAGLPGGLSLGVNTGAERDTSAHALAIQGPDLLRQLASIALDDLGLEGVLIHVNNLENMADVEAETAAQTLRELRDPCLMIPGLHYIVVGTDDAIRRVITDTPQLRSVFGHGEVVHPLSVGEVEKLLEKRYEYLRLDPKRPVPPLVTTESLHELYEIFRGDLRGTLSALEAAAKRIAALGEHPTDPMEPEAMRSVLRNVYQQYAQAALNANELNVLRKLHAQFGKETFTQKQAQKVIGVGKPRTSEIVSALTNRGFLLPSGFAAGRGRPAQLYHLAGTALLAFQ